MLKMLRDGYLHPQDDNNPLPNSKDKARTNKYFIHNSAFSQANSHNFEQGIMSCSVNASGSTRAIARKTTFKLFCSKKYLVVI
jgi:hypothetical protein